MDGCDAYPVSDGFREVMRIELLEGEWFSEDYDHVDWLPVIINRKFAEERFGDHSPLGKTLNEPDEDERMMRVIGVMEDFRKEGEFSSPANIGYWRISLTNEEASATMPSTLLIRVRPGTGVQFERRLAERLQNTAPEWSFEITPIETIRQEFLMSDYLAPLMAGGTIVVFLLLMVGLGLTGVLWLTITRRTREIGLRRAEGATGRHIYFQILGEFLLLATLSMLAGVVILIQFPLLDVLGFVNMGVYTLSILATMIIIYLLTIFSALYPSRLAVRVQPVEALHYE
jgi:putative ABC transport system permease protein